MTVIITINGDNEGYCLINTCYEYDDMMTDYDFNIDNLTIFYNYKTNKLSKIYYPDLYKQNLSMK